MKTSQFSMCVAICAIAFAETVSAQTLYLDYNFNDSGTTTANSGSLGGTASMYQSNGTTPVDLHGAAGSGVSGLAGDLALDLTGATGMGLGFTGPMVNAGTGGNPTLASMTSFTIAGWINSSVALSTASNSARIFDFGDRAKLFLSNNGVVLSLGATGDYGSGAMVANPLWTTANQWVFYAITYDGTNLSFYYGGEETAVFANGVTGSLTGKTLAASSAEIIGNRAGGDRPFDGYMDNFQIYGATSGASGALSAGALETLRASALVPEPTTVALLGLGLTAMLLRRKRSFCS